MTSRFAKPPAPPLSLTEVNIRLVALADELEGVQKSIEPLLREHQQVSLRYELEYAAVVASSDHRSEDRRKAEATVAMTKVRMDDSPMDLATRKAVLEVQIKSLREAGHNVRAAIQACQTLSSNLRAEASLGGVRT